MYEQVLSLDKEMLHRELAEAGCSVTRSDTDGVPILDVLDPTEQSVADAVIAAHNQPLLSAAVIALRDLLGSGSVEWARYLKLRINARTQKRKAYYRAKTDELLFDCLADAVLEDVDGTNSRLIVETAKFQAWLDARAAIQSDIEY